MSPSLVCIVTLLIFESKLQKKNSSSFIIKERSFSVGTHSNDPAKKRRSIADFRKEENR
ncbi:hypothetical protein EMLAB_13400 [Enterococcus mundtii]|nr:hypothetical protein EMLAB_13400 [Enterococcus mundtii]